MGSSRLSAPLNTRTPREPCCPAARAAWCLPSRTAWPPRPWGRLALTWSTGPSRLTRALQCMTCHQGPLDSSGSLCVAGLKTPRSCRSALWTAVPASSPPSIPRAKSSPGLLYRWHPEPFCRSPPCTLTLSPTAPKGRQPLPWSLQSHRRDWAGPAIPGLCALLLARSLSGFAGDLQDHLFKGNLESLYWTPVPSSCQPSKDTRELTRT